LIPLVLQLLAFVREDLREALHRLCDETVRILNHPNFLPPLDNEAVLSSDGSVANKAGEIDATSTDPRQIQFGVKINF